MITKKGCIELLDNKDIQAYLITEETVASAPDVMSDNSQSIKFTAELQEAERPNRNGRIYGKNIIDQALNHYSVQEKIKNKAFYGESGHPNSDDIKRQMYLDQRNISHIVTGFEWQGNKLIGTLETAQTAAGQDMRGLIRQGSNVAFSMRGMSKVVTRDGQYQRVGGPLSIVAYDWVIIPSHQDSYMISKMNEGMREGSE